MDLTPLLTPLVIAARYATVAYAVTATVLTTACLTLHVVTQLDRVALGRRSSRTGRPESERRLFVPLDHSAASI